MEGDGEDGLSVVGEGFDFFPGVGIVDVNLLVLRSSDEQWLGRVEGEGPDEIGTVGEGFDFFPGVGIVDVDLVVKRSSGEQW